MISTNIYITNTLTCSHSVGFCDYSCIIVPWCLLLTCRFSEPTTGHLGQSMLEVAFKFQTITKKVMCHVHVSCTT